MQLRISRKRRPHFYSTTHTPTCLWIPQPIIINHHQINQIPFTLPLPPLTPSISDLEEKETESEAEEKGNLEDTEMDDSCAVCAEPLEWVAYGPCGHRDVCVTCIARLRFVCNDRRCCICKSDSDIVFATKALGDYTRLINDFSVFPVDAKEGKVGSYWYHEDAKAYFDDLDAYKVIKAMCMLSCSICDKTKGEGKEASKREAKFRNIDQLKGHLFHQHELLFCSLCLEGRKVFMCEQKLYNRSQLKQHIKGGDSDVDGSESERCGFSGHPPCEFCHIPFYGDNELYRHMSTEHYTCHLCQRLRPGQFDYYKDYDELEKHFSQAHFLCEDDSCLGKKFIVFASESEMKRHHAMEHGGQMSRSKRNAALQIPTCFQFQQRERDRRHVRGCIFGPDHQIYSIAQDSTETAYETMLCDAASIVQAMSADRVTREISSIGRSRDLAATHFSSGHSQSEGILEESAFPPLPTASKRRRRKSKNNAVGSSGSSSMAARLRRRADGSLATANLSPASSASYSQPSSSATSTSQFRVASNSAHCARSNEPLPSSSIISSSDRNSTRKVNPPSHSSLPQRAGYDEPVSRVEDVQSANKNLVGRICAALENDKDRYAAFKLLSKEYREGLIGVAEYVAYLHQFGLSHLVADLAILCPDPEKQRELMEVHNASLGGGINDVGKENARSSGPAAHRESRKGSKKGKEKCEDNGTSSSSLIDMADVVNGVKKLQLNQNTATSVGLEEQLSSHEANVYTSTSDRSSGLKSGKQKKPKKTPKFVRSRLGESPLSAVASHREGSDSVTSHGPGEGPPLPGMVARGVWRNGGGRKLVGMVQTWSR